jgi:hypothetical protein
VKTVGRIATGVQHPKLREIVHKDLRNYSSIEMELSGFDGCFFCLGVSSAGMKEAAMWARVKGKTENALLRLPFKAAYMFRPGIIEPLHGAKSKTASVRLFYTFTKPLLTVLPGVFPSYILTTEQIGRAMIEVVRHGTTKRVLETKDIRAIIPGSSR